MLPILVVFFLFDSWKHACRDANKPEEFGQIIPAIIYQAAKNYKDIICVEFSCDLDALFFVTGEEFADGGDVCVVPGVVVHNDGAVAHPRNLIAIIPPRQHFVVLFCILFQPVVGFSVVVDYDPITIILTALRKHN